MKDLWRDGAIIPADQATLSALAHSMQRGSLVFDVASFHATPRGIEVFRLREHVVRFLRSASIVGMRMRWDEAALCDATCAAVRASGLRDGLIRMSAFFATLESDLVPSNSDASVVIVGYGRNDFPKTHVAGPTLAIQIPLQMRKAAPNAIPPLAKVAASYLGPMIARRAALSAGYDEVVLLDHEGFVAEAPTANVFAVIRGELVTPPLGSILDGITRDAVMQLAREEGIPVREAKMTAAELRAADEAFLTATSYLVAPIARIDDKVLPSTPGPISARLKARFARVLAGEDTRSAQWMTRVE